MRFKERLRFVPFKGDFSKSKDFTLEDDFAVRVAGGFLRMSMSHLLRYAKQPMM
jgi:phage/plasmid-associated DNA primase